VSDDCLFCKIADHSVGAQIVTESDDVLAFRDINPVASTHVLVIPKRHIASAADLGAHDGGLLTEMFQMMAQIVGDEGLERGHRIVTNVGVDGGQTVDHLHFHLIGGRPMSWPPG
jgi:histidine triad (HIT) family protein